MRRVKEVKAASQPQQGTDSELLEFLARHVCAYSSLSATRFGFDFNTSRPASDSYYQDFRREIRERMSSAK